MMPASLSRADLAIVVNPNNPDGGIVRRETLLQTRENDCGRAAASWWSTRRSRDVAPAGTSLASDVGRGNIVVLRSFGKFFGLAGLRLGFAIAAPNLINRLDAMLGPWAVAGPAIFVGETALADQDWKEQTHARLTETKARLDALLTGAGLEVVGGTSLYRLTRSADAEKLFSRLGSAGILVRRFGEEPTWLRWGLPRNENDWRRLTDTLSSSR